MWVSIDDWHENPDIIHTKFTWSWLDSSQKSGGKEAIGKTKRRSRIQLANGPAKNEAKAVTVCRVTITKHDNERRNWASRQIHLVRFGAANDEIIQKHGTMISSRSADQQHFNLRDGRTLCGERPKVRNLGIANDQDISTSTYTTTVYFCSSSASHIARTTVLGRWLLFDSGVQDWNVIKEAAPDIRDSLLRMECLGTRVRRIGHERDQGKIRPAKEPECKIRASASREQVCRLQSFLSHRA